MSEAPLIDSFAEIEDPRHPRNTLYPIEEILLLSICGAISGADDFVSIDEFGEAKLGWLRGLLPFEYGVPSHDTLTRVFDQIEPSGFERCFRAWTRRVEEKTDGQVVAIDGKTLRGSRDRAAEEGPLHLVEAWACGQELMLGQRRLDVGFGAGHTDMDAGHGRVETRRCWAIDIAGKGLVDESRWSGLQSVALVETERFLAEPQAEAGPVKGETETERRYLISSLKADAEKILEASRRHWQIENRLHWVLDLAFEEDHSQVRTQNAAENLALVRRLVASAVKQDDRVDAGTKKQTKAGWVERQLPGAPTPESLTCNRPGWSPTAIAS